MQINNDLIETDLIVDSAISRHLKETAVWGKFLAIAGFLLVLISVGAIYAAIWHIKSSPSTGKNGKGVTADAMIGIIYLLMIVVIFFMSACLFRFAKKTQAALSANDQSALTKAFSLLKVYFRLVSFIIGVVLITSVLGFVKIIIAAAYR